MVNYGSGKAWFHAEKVFATGSVALRNDALNFEITVVTVPVAEVVQLSRYAVCSISRNDVYVSVNPASLEMPVAI